MIAKEKRECGAGHVKGCGAQIETKYYYSSIEHQLPHIFIWHILKLAIVRLSCSTLNLDHMTGG